MVKRHWEKPGPGLGRADADESLSRGSAADAAEARILRQPYCGAPFAQPPVEKWTRFLFTTHFSRANGYDTLEKRWKQHTSRSFAQDRLGLGFDAEREGTKGAIQR